MELIADIAILNKKDIRKLTLDNLKTWMTENGEKPFRAKQVYEWLWKNSAQSFAEMNNIALPLREKLDAHFAINSVQVATKQLSNDGTIKSAFQLFDNNIVEGVLIPHEERMTACVSSQVGCSLTCKFCATGYMDRITKFRCRRNLRPGSTHKRTMPEPVRHAAYQYCVHGYGRTDAELRQCDEKH